MNDHIQYDFLYDNHFAELKEAELRERKTQSVASLVEPFIGKYYSQDYVRRHVLRQSDAEIKEQDELINQEIKEGKIPDPAMAMAMEMGGGDPVDGWTTKCNSSPSCSSRTRTCMRLLKVERSK